MLWKTLTSFIVLGLIVPTAQADTDTANGMNYNGNALRMGRNKRDKRNAARKQNKDPDTLRGGCAIVESPSNPLPGPCVNLLLVLNDPNGNEIAKVRTTPKGQFDFAVDSTKSYKLASGSKFYDVVSPTEEVHGGDQVSLKLVQK